MDRALADVLSDVPFRQWTFSLPKVLRVFFRFDGGLLKELARLVVTELTRYFRSVTGRDDLTPGFVVLDQTFGTLPDDFHPHQHTGATDLQNTGNYSHPHTDICRDLWGGCLATVQSLVRGQTVRAFRSGRNEDRREDRNMICIRSGTDRHSPA